MAEIVSSALVHETVSQLLSNLVQKYEEKVESSANRNLERLEMAHIRLEAALEMSEKWQITDASLLRWRGKLKRAAQECDDTLHRCKQRILENEQTEEEVRKSSFPVRIAHTTKSFVSSIFSPNKDESNSSTVRRFEWFTDGASEFLRLLELGGRPRHHMPFDPLVRHLLNGKKLQHRIIQANRWPLFLQLVPYITSDYGIEAKFIFIQTDGNASEDDFFFSLMLQLSESTDIVGMAIQCLQLYAPLFNFKSAVETFRNKLLQLPTEDFSWVPDIDTHHKEHWDILHRFGIDWFRPNPLCCKQHDQHKLRKLNRSRLRDVFLEPVIEVHLECHVSVLDCNQHRSLLSEAKYSLQDSPYLKVGLLVTPHGCLEDILLVDRTPAVPVIYCEEQHFLHTDFTLGQLEETMLPKAIDYFCKNDEAAVYQMLGKLEHGAAYIQVEKASMGTQRTSMRTSQGPRKGKMLQWHDPEIGRKTSTIFQFLNLWVAHAPVQLQGTIVNWIQKEKEKQLAALQLHQKFQIM